MEKERNTAGWPSWNTAKAAAQGTHSNGMIVLQLYTPSGHLSIKVKLRPVTYYEYS